MSDAGTPQGPQQAQQARQQVHTRPARAQIESLPGNVRDSTGAQRIRGEVLGTRDGVTRIQTREGEVRLRLPEGQRPVQGRAVEIELSSGRAREQAIVRLQARQARVEASLTRQSQPLPDPAREVAVRSDNARASQSQPDRQRIQLSRELAQSLSRARPPGLSGQAQNVTSGQPVRLIALDTSQSAQFLRQLPQAVQVRLTTAQLAGLIDAQQGATPTGQKGSQAQAQTPAASARLVPRIGALIAALQAGTSQQNTGAQAPQQATQQANLLNASLLPQGQGGTGTQQVNITATRAGAQNLLPDNIANTLKLSLTNTQQGALIQAPSASSTSTPQPGASQITNQIDARFLSQPNVTLTLKTAQNQAITSLSAGAQPGATSSPLTARIGAHTAHQLINNQISATSGFTPQNGVLTGQIIGQTQSGLPVLQLNLPGSANSQQLFTLQFNAGNLGTGAQASFTTAASGGSSAGLQAGAQTSLLGLSTGQLISLPASTGTQGLFTGALDPAPGQTLAGDLSEAIQTLQSSGQARMAQNLQAMIPNAANSQQLGPAAMLFVAAARGGDLSNWLGNNSIEMLRRAGRGDLASRLTGASGNITGAGGASDTAGGEWRALNMPVAWQDEIHAIRLHYRHPGQDGGQGTNDDDDKNKQTRFVFDLTLSRMGAVQLDGLFKEKKLDLVVRTEERLSSDMRQHLRQNYIHALEVAGLNGELRFQNAPGSWIHFTDNTSDNHSESGTFALS